MIRSFRDRRTAAVYLGQRPKGFPEDIARTAQRKLAQLAAAGRIEEMASPPGNTLEALKGNRGGQWSIRINVQWRICFIWREGHAEDAEITDYHR